MNKHHQPRIVSSGLSLLFVLLIVLAACTNAPSGTTPAPTASVSSASATSAPTVTTLATSTPNTPTPTPTRVATVTPTPRIPTLTPTPTRIVTVTPRPVVLTWSVSQVSNILQIGYGSNAYRPQYGALDVNSGYFRLNYGPGSGWGTSIILLPAFWSASSCAPGGYCQGAPVVPAWQVQKGVLVLTITGTIGGLNVTTTVQLSPPGKNTITAQVTTSVQGSVTLDNRPGEAFKPVMLSSMHESSTQWDARLAYAGSSTYAFPASGWILQPPASAQSFGLLGGTSSWKTNAPSVGVTLDRTLQITGWVTQDNNPTDDNVGYWCATNQVLSSWSYTVVVSP